MSERVISHITTWSEIQRRTVRTIARLCQQIGNRSITEEGVIYKLAKQKGAVPTDRRRIICGFCKLELCSVNSKAQSYHPGDWSMTPIKGSLSWGTALAKDHIDDTDCHHYWLLNQFIKLYKQELKYDASVRLTRWAINNDVPLLYIRGMGTEELIAVESFVHRFHDFVTACLSLRS